MRRTTIRIDENLLQQAKRLAARSGRTLTAVIEDALRAAVLRRSARPPDERIELPTYGQGGTMLGVDLDVAASLLDATESDS